MVVDRDTASRLGLTMYQIDNTLYDAFGQRSVSTIYDAENQYHVVMEVAPQYWQRPSILKQIWISTSGAQAGGSATTALAAGSVTAGSARGVATASAPQCRRFRRRGRRAMPRRPTAAPRCRTPCVSLANHR